MRRETMTTERSQMGTTAMKAEQRRRFGLLASGITYGFLWTDICQWGDVLIWLERVAPKILLWG
jgi:hypothetical protein